MYAAIAVAAVVTIYALIGLLGKLPSGTKGGLGRAFVSAVPIMIASGAATMAIGFSITSALIAAVSVFLAVVLSGWVNRAGWERFRPATPAASAMTWLCSLAALVGLSLLLLDFTAGLISDVIGLRYWVVVLVLALGGAVAGFGRGGQVGQARVVLFAVPAVAVVLLIVGAILGSPGYLGTEMIPAGTPGLTENVVFPIALVLAALLLPGIGAGARAGRRGVLAAAVIAGATVLLATLGLLMLLGGLIQVPSVQLNVLVAFMPAPVTTAIAMVTGALAVTVLSRSVAVALDGLALLEPDLPWRQDGALARRLGLAGALAVAWMLLAWWSPSPVTVVAVLAVSAVAGLGARRWARTHSPDRSGDGAAHAPEAAAVG